MPVIDRIDAIEILDSRGRPTVKATVSLASGVTASASIPSGASTGAAEAWELRDGDPARYGGLGCRKAVANVRGEIASLLAGREYADQSGLDEALIALDGTPNKSRLGGNAILAVSVAFARACAANGGGPFYRHFGGMAGIRPGAMPTLTVNLFSGGKHAGGQVPIQDVLLVPVAAKSIDESLSTVYAVYQAAAELIASRYGMRLLRADEGGLAPPCKDVDTLLELTVEAITQAGYKPGAEVALAVDVAASHFHLSGQYHIEAKPLSSAEMIDRLSDWRARFPIISFEDGLAEEDWPAWPALTRALGDRTTVIGDDLLCTNPARIRRAIDSRAANAVLLKVNQVGTLTEAAEALKLARDAGWSVTVSARSGETEDNWLADLAVGWGADFIKIGSITQSDRLAKYNRLLEIEADTGWSSPAKP